MSGVICILCMLTIGTVKKTYANTSSGPYCYITNECEMWHPFLGDEWVTGKCVLQVDTVGIGCGCTASDVFVPGGCS